MMLLKIAELNLQAIQHVIQINGPSKAYLIEEKEAHKKFEEAMDRQETFWKEKAHLNWHMEGDRNTKYFHRISKIKISSKTITTLQNGEQVLTEQAHISEHIIV